LIFNKKAAEAGALPQHRFLLRPTAHIPTRHFSVHVSVKDSLKPITLPNILDKYSKNIPLTMLTAHDYSSGHACDQANIDMILVGDSLSMTALGHPNTLKVTMKEMIHHAKAVKRGVNRSFLIGDMPFGSYFNNKDALKNSAKFIRDSEMNAIKLEGGRNVAHIVKEIVRAGIVVMGHIGLTPQQTNTFGGFKVFGARAVEEAMLLWEDAKILRDAGASFIVLECVPDRMATLISKNLGIPTIGIGSGPGCSGQVLVFNDLIGVYDKLSLKFCKKYADLNPVIINACEAYKHEVENKLFPVKPTHTFIIKEEIFKEVNKRIIQEMEKIHPITSSVTETKPIKNKENINSLPVKNIVVLGTGALGSLIAARLSQNSATNVRLIDGRNMSTDDAYKINIGLNEDSSNKSTQHIVKNLKVDELNNQWNKQIDLLVVCVKNYGTEEALNNLLTLTSNKVLINNVITLQNGFGNTETISKTLEKLGLKSNVFQCSIYSGVKINEKNNNLINISQSVSDDIQIALPEALAHSEIEKLFKENQFKVSNYIKPSYLKQELNVDWGKLIINSVINPITAIFNVQNKVISENEQAIQLCKSIIHECVNILRFIPGALAAIQKEKNEDVEALLFSNVMNVAKTTGSNISSTLTDLLRNEGKTEIESFNGAFVKLAKELGLAKEYYSVNETIVNLIQGTASIKNSRK